MSRGRKRTPDRILTLRGSSMVSRKTGKRYDGTGVDAPPGSPPMPEWLTHDPFAAVHYKSLLPDIAKMGVLAKIDAVALARYCETYAEWVRQRAIRDASRDMKKRTAFNRAFSRMMALAADLRKYEAEFGLTPAARSKLRADVGNKPPEQSKAKEFFA